MPVPLIRAAMFCGLFALIAFCFSENNGSFAQRRSPFVCKQTALDAIKPVPELIYECSDLPNDWDEKVLEFPARREAIKNLIPQLAALTDAAWWTTDVVDLNACDFKKEPGTLTAEERRSFADGEYPFWLFGNDRARLVLLPDPCYQTQYGGSNAFLLHRNGGKVFVTQVLDGYFSRADNSVGLAFAKLKAEEIIEISTGTGGLNPSVTNYYFSIDPQTNEAVPKRLFHGASGSTNRISSPLLLNAAEPLKIVRNNALAPNFFIYRGNGSKLSRKVLRWNGNVYR
jgi:hypothetical protein